MDDGDGDVNEVDDGVYGCGCGVNKNVTRTRNSKSLDTKTSNATHDATKNSTMQKLSDNREMLRLSGTQMY